MDDLQVEIKTLNSFDYEIYIVNICYSKTWWDASFSIAKRKVIFIHPFQLLTYFFINAHRVNKLN